MDPFGPDSRFNQPPRVSEPRAIDTSPDLGILSQIHNRLAALENDNREIRGILDEAQKSGSIDPELLPHLAHIASKHFHHDRPLAEVAAPAVPKFDPYTGAPLN